MRVMILVLKVAIFLSETDLCMEGVTTFTPKCGRREICQPPDLCRASSAFYQNVT